MFRRERQDGSRLDRESGALLPYDFVAMSAGLTQEEFDQWLDEHGSEPVPVLRQDYWALLEKLRAWKADRP